MYQTIDFYQFRDAFIQSSRANQFSLEALDALYDYITDYEESCGEQIELDVIALCCEFQEIHDDEEEFEKLKDDEDRFIAKLSRSILIREG